MNLNTYVIGTLVMENVKIRNVNLLKRKPIVKNRNKLMENVNGMKVNVNMLS